MNLVPALLMLLNLGEGLRPPILHLLRRPFGTSTFSNQLRIVRLDGQSSLHRFNIHLPLNVFGVKLREHYAGLDLLLEFRAGNHSVPITPFVHESFAQLVERGFGQRGPFWLVATIRRKEDVYRNRRNSVVIDDDDDRTKKRNQPDAWDLIMWDQPPRSRIVEVVRSDGEVDRVDIASESFHVEGWKDDTPFVEDAPFVRDNFDHERVAAWKDESDGGGNGEGGGYASDGGGGGGGGDDWGGSDDN